MAWEQWLAYFVACWIICLSPGAGAVASMSAGRACGFRRGYWNVLGLEVALIFQILIVAAGLGAVLATSHVAFAAIKWLGVAYLLYLGWRQWTAQASAADAASSTRQATSRKRLVARGFLVNMSNPKAIVFFLAVLPQFLDPARPLLMQYLWLTLTMVVVDSIVMAGYTGLASQVLQALKSPRQQKLLNRTFGALFMGAAGLLASVHR
ncbi:MAG TPA: LysE family transporter [Burkholderiaceae bacterium]|nr:LysE family transporter [Burkholderiaceae bacterium]